MKSYTYTCIYIWLLQYVLLRGKSKMYLNYIIYKECYKYNHTNNKCLYHNLQFVLLPIFINCVVINRKTKSKQ